MGYGASRHGCEALSLRPCHILAQVEHIQRKCQMLFDLRHVSTWAKWPKWNTLSAGAKRSGVPTPGSDRQGICSPLDRDLQLI
jgi:hypothetical protein